MNTSVLERADAQIPASVAIVDTVAELSAIRDTGCAAAIMKRDPIAVLHAWLNTLAPDCLPEARLILRPDAVQKTVEQICDACGTPQGLARQILAHDIAELARNFARLMNVTHIRLRLDVVTTNACKKFHIDALTARLICTYRGQTTQLGEATPDGEPDSIFSVPQGCPVILRGTQWKDDTPTSLKHRSPPIEGSGETRLLLVMDPIYDLDEEV